MNKFYLLYLKRVSSFANYKYLFVCSIILGGFSNLQAQNKFTVSGTIKDAQTGETLIGATIKLQEVVISGVTSNSYGFYSLSAGKGNYHLLISYTGYQSVSKNVNLNQNLKLNIQLSPGTNLNEVTITGRAKKDEALSSPQMGLQAFSIKEIKDVPVLLGERDVLKTIQLLPGIKSAGEGNSGFYVRGGAADQNLILLDEATVYNASHLLGFFSTFNSDAIKDVNLYKGNMPAQYGGRLASVVDIKMNDGNQKEYTAEGGIGLIASRLKVEGPIVKDRGSFMISGRRTYADVFLKASSDTTLKQSSLYFYDLNAKANYRLDDKNTVYLSAYLGKDALGLGNTFNLNWGNQTGTLRLNHLFSSRLFSNTTLIYSNYNYEITNSTNNQDFKVTSKINDYEFKEDFQYFLNDKHQIRFGLDAVHHTIAPGNITSSETSSINSKTLEERYGAEISAYISDEWRATDRLNIVYGLRVNAFSLLGSGTFSTYNADGSIASSAVFSSGKLVKTYINPEPRASASYRLDSVSSVKASYSRNTQNLHLLSNSTSSLPTDLWIMSSNNIKPEIADQESLGYYRNLKDNRYEFSTEVYYKSMQNQIDYKNAAELRANENVESQLLFGTGRAYGVEFFLKKKEGIFTGWLGYTLSRTERKFDGINDGNYFPAKQDRTHDISAVGIYKLSKRWTLSGTFVYSTGNAITFPSGKYTINGETTFYYSERNGYRMPAYHRLDLSATLEGKPHPKYHSSWTFGLYNAYDHHNAYVIEFKDNPNDPSRTEAEQTALFGIIPSVTWNFKF
ncbi:TonB-dependent receptor [Mucilaginibacter arboris]|uniref:TonB-dependent receptor plug domain-containing protein n=1 Tax=Mucilaginibacter arboris TaxID=2682090 RepID=A0A7K1SX49_9SPHI|nr:TonB-dependent receptor [Mucilaginibacter arboris]MVN21873.1 TonB-dependent receptor plug domain-containing protein [Mucilaginibacter arboris]